MTLTGGLEWLCRTEKNEILGPMSLADVRQRVMSREFGPNDEICKSASYWFSVKEVDEVRQFLGIDPPLVDHVVPEGATLAITRTNIQTKESEYLKSAQSSLTEKKPNEIPQVSSLRPPRIPVQPSSGLGGVFWVKWIAFVLGFILIVVVARIYMLTK